MDEDSKKIKDLNHHLEFYIWRIAILCKHAAYLLIGLVLLATIFGVIKIF